MESNKTTIFSPAKLNLGLKIVGKREDGYHLLESLFWPISLVDDIELARATDGKNSVTTKFADGAVMNEAELPSADSNVVTKVLERFVPNQRWNIAIEKRIPIGGGLGGGSSNAGTVAKHVVSGEISLPEISKSGADIPFFLNPVPSWVTGIGENVTPIPLSATVRENLKFFLVFPPISTSTKDVFQRLGKYLPNYSASSEMPSLFTYKQLRTFLQSCRNDLLPAVIEMHPLIGEIVSYLRKCDQVLYADLSGTGSTCYAVFENEAALKKTTKEFDLFCREHRCKGIAVQTFGVCS